MKIRYGFTLLEIIIAFTVLLILASAVMPLVKNKVIRNKELELRHALREIRLAIDAYKDDIDTDKIEHINSAIDGYPLSLDNLIDGQKLIGLDRKKYFLRRIPMDPMTHQALWGVRTLVDVDGVYSVADSSSGIYDVYSLSHKIGTNGIPYDKW